MPLLFRLHILLTVENLLLVFRTTTGSASSKMSFVPSPLRRTAIIHFEGESLGKSHLSGGWQPARQVTP